MNDTCETIMADMAIRFFDNRCFVTHEKFKKRGFVIHHLWYIENDVRREDYKPGEKGRLRYLTSLRKMIERMPYRFMLLKNGMHIKIDHYKRGLSRMKRENFSRLCVAVLLTRKKTIIKKHYKRYR